MFQDNLPIRVRPTADDILMVYDTSRAKLLSSFRDPLSFSIDHANLNADMYMKFGGLYTNTNGYLVRRNAVVTCVSVRCKDAADATFLVQKNGGSSVTSISLSSEVYKVNDGLNIDLIAGDWVQIYMQVNSGVVNYPVALVELAWTE